MRKYILKRILYCFFVLIGVSIISFSLIHIAPGNPARLMLPDGATDEEIYAMSEKLGLDKPAYIQYIIYITNVLKGDLGTSFYYKEPNIKLIFERVPASLLLATSAVLFSLFVSLPLGVFAAVKRGSKIDLFAMFVAILGQSMSSIWLGVLLIFIFSVRLNLLPPFGYGSIIYLIMPTVTLGFPLAGLITRLTRAGMIDVLSEDYILATRAKGVPESKLIFKYSLKNVMIPITTVVGIQFGTIWGGAIVTEQIFGWPGIGKLLVSSAMSRDFPLLQSLILVISFFFIFINLGVDIFYTFIDPRVKFK
jgi:ABC-type dipeptide/oligopeptide/nickel transport system permease component